ELDNTDSRQPDRDEGAQADPEAVLLQKLFIHFHGRLSLAARVDSYSLRRAGGRATGPTGRWAARGRSAGASRRLGRPQAIRRDRFAPGEEDDELGAVMLNVGRVHPGAVLTAVGGAALAALAAGPRAAGFARRGHDGRGHAALAARPRDDAGICPAAPHAPHA